ncbi:MAG: hypothetical protein ACRCX2_04385 [Paraclostridium sp.]
MDYVNALDNKHLKGMEFTEDGYVVCNGLFIGLVEDGWEWYGDYDKCKEKTMPVINFKEIESIKEYVDSY